MAKTAAWLVVAALTVGASNPASAECTCRARGMTAIEGQTVCIATPSGPRLARCEKVQNVTSWKFLQEGCPSAESLTPISKAPVGLAFSR